MKLAEYNLLTEHFEMDMDLYRQLLKDVATASPDRVNAILGIFTCLHVDESWDGDVEEIKAEGMAEIMEKYPLGDDSSRYAELIWMMPSYVSESLFGAIEQLC
jgi:hypothetical protein